jgi:hypothetical protein
MTKNEDDSKQERNGNERGAEINVRAYVCRKALRLYSNTFDYFYFYSRVITGHVWLLICILYSMHSE